MASKIEFVDKGTLGTGPSLEVKVDGLAVGSIHRSGGVSWGYYPKGNTLTAEISHHEVEAVKAKVKAKFGG